jgi:recombinational DNA repair protein RecT
MHGLNNILKQSNMSEQKNLMQVIKESTPAKVLTMPEVKQKFITNYEQAHGVGKGELAFQKNLAYLQQRLSEDSFKNVTSISVYKMLIMIAIRGYDLDPTEGEVYLMPYNTTIDLQKQAPYLVRRLKETKQLQEFFPAQLIFEGDDFKIKDGMVIDHSRNLKSQKIIAGYVKGITAKGKEICFIYTPENWDQWKKASKMPGGNNWKGGPLEQPTEAFLKTKIVLHACKEKVWASSRSVITEDFFPEVETEDESPEGIDPEPIDVPHREIKEEDEF